MRRFLSWIVMVIAFFVMGFLLTLALGLDRLVMGEIYRLSSILYWAAIILGGATILGIFFGIAFWGSMLTVKLSQLVWKSKKGTRYTVWGIYCILNYALMIILGLANVRDGVDIAAQVIYLVASVIFLFIGRSMAEEDGGPPTKRERLQAKIDKIDAAEARKQGE